LPDFSWHIIPKPLKCSKSTQNVPNQHKMYQIVLKYPNVGKIFQMAIQFVNQLKSRAIQNLPKLGFLGFLATLGLKVKRIDGEQIIRLVWFCL
jgi:hypothetical protein